MPGLESCNHLLLRNSFHSPSVTSLCSKIELRSVTPEKKGLCRPGSLERTQSESLVGIEQTRLARTWSVNWTPSNTLQEKDHSLLLPSLTFMLVALGWNIWSVTTGFSLCGLNFTLESLQTIFWQQTRSDLLPQQWYHVSPWIRKISMEEVKWLTSESWTDP